MLDNIARENIGFFPTPIVELKRLAKTLGGPRIFMKRDDLSGVACGGNKVRKLEFLLGEAVEQGADCVITGGAAQSNHCRQTAAAAAMVGLPCHLALGGDAPDHYQGNILLDRLLGATLHWCGADRKGERIPYLCEMLRQQGGRPYVIPYGGSNMTGALGFVAAVVELDNQMNHDQVPVPTHLVFASSSGGTQAGLIVGKALLGHAYQIIGIGVDKEELAGIPLSETVFHLIDGVADRLGERRSWKSGDVTIDGSYAGPGYGVLSPLEREAVTMVAKTEGILLDPVYTGRAMGGMIDMIRSGKFTSRDTILFWHTGGTPALFSYADQLSP